MTDKLIFDLSQEIEGSPNVFVQKSWLNILDNMSQNYNSNMSVIDTSQLSNSNKYLSYRESYLLMPLMLTLSSTTAGCTFAPGTTATSADYALGLKNWFGTMIHSFTLDYMGTTIIQQTPFINIVNSFKLMTSLSWNDVTVLGSTIGFYPDDPLTWTYYTPQAAGIGFTFGQGVCNNSDFGAVGTPSTITTTFNHYNAGSGNRGLLQRQQYINFDADGVPSITGAVAGGFTAYGGSGVTAGLLQQNAANLVWKSYIYNKTNIGAGGGILQIAVSATIYLKHVHSFFEMCPLLKGVFMKMTMNLNNSSTTFSTTLSAAGALTSVNLGTVSVPVGGVNPLMLTSAAATQGGLNLGGVASATTPFIATVQVGAKCLNSTVAAIAGYQPAPLAQSIYLYVPAYTFNPIYESAYLSSPVKQINYSDYYQYQVFNVQPGAQFNSLLTNGIAGVKSIVILPYYSSTGAANANGVNPNTALPLGMPVFQSPFDPAGSGPTSPLALLTNFNVVVSGQNAIYNTQRYDFEEFNNQFYGCNAVNGGQTSGLNSGLVNSLGFEMEYCYYYVNLERMLPVEESVPKSIQIIGQNISSQALDLFCFIEYSCNISIDILSGSRV